MSPDPPNSVKADATVEVNEADLWRLRDISKHYARAMDELDRHGVPRQRNGAMLTALARIEFHFDSSVRPLVEALQQIRGEANAYLRVTGAEPSLVRLRDLADETLRRFHSPQSPEDEG